MNIRQPYSVEVIQKPVRYHSDPTKIFHHVCKSNAATLLLETAEIHKKTDLESILIVDSAIRCCSLNNSVNMTAVSQNGYQILLYLTEMMEQKLIDSQIRYSLVGSCLTFSFPPFQQNIDEDKKIFALSVFDSLRLILKIFNQEHVKKNNKAIFLGGLFSYDLIEHFECFPDLKKTQKCSDFCFYLAETLLVIDHQKQTCVIQQSLFTHEIHEIQRIKHRGVQIEKILDNPLLSIPMQELTDMTLTSNMSDTEYCAMITQLQSFIQTGEIFQVVPSRKFFLPCKNPLSAYHQLKYSNPSPYMFFMQDIDFTLFGASPESSLKYDAYTRQIELYPIAGTRPRGMNDDGSINWDLDSRIELEMRTDQKELAEHLMLVDLARNDLARICEPGSRYVSDLLRVDKYSHVMHLVSKVIGRLRENLDALHAYSTCMNMGTLTGAPKVRAMQLIAEYEKEKRGSYGGAIGYLTGDGSLDTCITIRSAYIEHGIATIQAGAGIVHHSIPENEVNESFNKAQAVIHAIKKAHLFKELF